ncbi:MAG: outer membrane lipoprotein-sorting protein, partial [Parvularcula sp.]|nr:outer membrane lipoprotein-sorting protein [Parvularcula sp.]
MLPILLLLFVSPLGTQTSPAMSGDEVARLIDERPNDDLRTGEITFEIVDARGRSRERTAKLAVGTVEDSHRIVLAFTKPSTIRETAFLSHNHDDPQQTDETWLFLPATELVRRMPESDRADSFMGTELSFGDVTDDFKFGLADYTFEASSGVGGMIQLEGAASSQARAQELGYSGFSATV